MLISTLFLAARLAAANPLVGRAASSSTTVTTGQANTTTAASLTTQAKSNPTSAAVVNNRASQCQAGTRNVSGRTCQVVSLNPRATYQ